jgi:hypothetical protein
MCSELRSDQSRNTCGLHVKCLLLLSDLNQNLNVKRNFSGLVNNKLYENPLSCSEVVDVNGQTKQTDVLKLIVIFLQLFIVNTPKIINIAIAILIFLNLFAVLQHIYLEAIRP